jgi:hypothetical protein
MLLPYQEKLYDDKGEITLLTDSNFESTVLDDENSIWVVQFYSPSCTSLPSDRAHDSIESSPLTHPGWVL